MQKLFCKLGLHKWKFPNPFARICICCNRLDESHSDLVSNNTWTNVNEDDEVYWVTTRKSNYGKRNN